MYQEHTYFKEEIPEHTFIQTWDKRQYSIQKLHFKRNKSCMFRVRSYNDIAKSRNNAEHQRKL